MVTKKNADTFTTEGRAPVEVEHVVVPPEKGQEHGFIGAVRSDKDRGSYTVAGVTSEAAQASDMSTSASSATKAAASSTKSTTSKSTSTQSS